MKVKLIKLREETTQWFIADLTVGKVYDVMNTEEIEDLGLLYNILDDADELNALFADEVEVINED